MDLIERLYGSDQLVGLLLTLFATVVTGAVGWAAMQFRRIVLNRLSAGELDLLLRIGAMAVRYVEQTMPKAKGEAKLDEALRVASSYLVAYGVRADPERLRAIIESAVYTEVARAELPAALPLDG